MSQISLKFGLSGFFTGKGSIFEDGDDRRIVVVDIEFLKGGSNHVSFSTNHGFAAKDLLILFPLILNHFHHPFDILAL